MKPRSLKLAAPATLAILALSAAIAVADTTRDTYVASVEPICKRNSNANDRILRGVRKLVRKGKLKPAAARFRRAAAALNKAERQIAAVPRPAADARTLARWLGYLKTEAKLLAKIGRELKARKKSKASIDVVNLQHKANLANNTVLSFGFRYCRQNPSKYT
jgi:hypothetical protein